MSSTVRFPFGMVDIHGHWLPGVDDGAKSLEMSLRMARIAVDDGITTALATPHHLNGIYKTGAERVREEVAALRSEFARAGIELDLLPGSECHLVPELPRELAEGRAMTVADRGKAVLVELPVHSIPVGASTILEEILGLGLSPIIVHPERNSELARKPDRLAEWVEMGCLAQVTARSCIGKFGDLARDASKEMVTRGMIHFVASDTHRDRRRVPDMSYGRSVIEKWTNSEVGKLLAETYPRDLVLGRELELGALDEALPKRRRGWLRKMFGA
ncbi:protein-tyrosine phosphatase [Wenzhouxiangella sediminis]|uniref:protein-tyrosine-phosphatase n=2 Tax=Wenzhouxiangella sediminis TaxID=1792836 RepID=A0A3E1KCE1_9GAMM|nr:protein-tyrosine phosphatase [Wenzhouxiangella sediminis]